MKKPIALLALLLTSVAHSVPAQFDVSAVSNSIGGGSGLDTGIFFNTGDTIDLTVDTNDLWSAGALPRWSNADGLVATLLATGSDESGQAANVQIGALFGNHTQNGLTAPFGSLVGSLGSTFFVLGTSFNAAAPDSGNLLLYYWDSNNNDNADLVTVTIDDGSVVAPPNNGVPAPGALALIGLGLCAMGWRSRA